MNPSSSVPPYRVVPSGLFLSTMKQLLKRAEATGRLDEIIQVIKEIHARLAWIPLDYGEPLRDFVHLGIQKRIAFLGPLVLTFHVDEARRLVYPPVPFKLFSGSGL